MKRYVKVAMINDNPIFRIGLNAILRREEKVRIVGDYILIADLLTGAIADGTNFPELLILSSSVGNQSELFLIGKLKSLFPALKILAISFKKDYFYTLTLIQLDIDGILLNAQPDELISAIFTITNGSKFFSKEAHHELKVGNSGNNQFDSKQLLTTREQQIAHLIAAGSSSKEIALTLNISIRTVDCHRYNILTKLGLRNSAELAKVTTEFKMHQITETPVTSLF